MARDYVELDATPVMESCQQVGTAGYDPVKARQECYAFVKQIRRQFPDLPPGLTVRVNSNAHEFGNYLDVVATFEDDDRAACEAAYMLEEKLPEYWDDEAKKELGLS